MPDRPVHARAARALGLRPDEELRRVYREHVDAVHAFFAYSVTRAHAEDLTSATFEKVIRSWGRYDASRSAERTWIMAIARNQLIDHFRRQRHRDAVSIDEYPLLAESVIAPDSLERHLESDEVRSWLQALSARDRHALALRYGADLTARDIAELLDLTEANVHQILSRSLRKLREHAERTLT